MQIQKTSRKEVLEDKAFSCLIVVYLATTKFCSNRNTIFPFFLSLTNLNHFFCSPHFDFPNTKSFRHKNSRNQSNLQNFSDLHVDF